MQLSPNTIHDIKTHARSSYPNECCGVIVNNHYLPMKNIAANTREDFEIDANEILKFSDSLQAVIHSHTNGNTSPSELDFKSHMQMNLPWGLVVTDGNTCSDIGWFGLKSDSAPLVGREYHFGIHDCFSLIRDYYRDQLQIILNELPRDVSLLDDFNNAYLTHYAQFGFRQIKELDAHVGDVVLLAIRDKEPNHAGIIYSDNGLFLHHPRDQLSRIEPIFRWSKFVTHWLRHKDND